MQKMKIDQHYLLILLQVIILKSKSLEILKSISNYADICELGFPHNTPIADGGQIQTSAYRAIKNGIKINDVFSIANDFKKSKKTKPIILMGYYNMIFSI
jgi:tryptophan synthase alpha chain